MRRQEEYSISQPLIFKMRSLSLSLSPSIFANSINLSLNIVSPHERDTVLDSNLGDMTPLFLYQPTCFWPPFSIETQGQD